MVLEEWCELDLRWRLETASLLLHNSPGAWKS
jgi:hypothetical protein